MNKILRVIGKHIMHSTDLDMDVSEIYSRHKNDHTKMVYELENYYKLHYTNISDGDLVDRRSRIMYGRNNSSAIVSSTISSIISIFISEFLLLQIHKMFEATSSQFLVNPIGSIVTFLLLFLFLFTIFLRIFQMIFSGYVIFKDTASKEYFLDDVEVNLINEILKVRNSPLNINDKKFSWITNQQNNNTKSNEKKKKKDDNTLRNLIVFSLFGGFIAFDSLNSFGYKQLFGFVIAGIPIFMTAIPMCLDIISKNNVSGFVSHNNISIIPIKKISICIVIMFSLNLIAMSFFGNNLSSLISSINIVFLISLLYYLSRVENIVTLILKKMIHENDECGLKHNISYFFENAPFNHFETFVEYIIHYQNKQIMIGFIHTTLYRIMNTSSVSDELMNKIKYFITKTSPFVSFNLDDGSHISFIYSYLKLMNLKPSLLKKDDIIENDVNNLLLSYLKDINRNEDLMFATFLHWLNYARIENDFYIFNFLKKILSKYDDTSTVTNAVYFFLKTSITFEQQLLGTSNANKVEEIILDYEYVQHNMYNNKTGDFIRENMRKRIPMIFVLTSLKLEHSIDMNVREKIERAQFEQMKKQLLYKGDFPDMEWY